MLLNHYSYFSEKLQLKTTGELRKMRVRNQFIPFEKFKKG